jgi:tetratricopeptide (TPR) repeat protein
VLLRESQVQPLLLVFEDLHWIDSETQALLDSLVESLPTAHMLLLVNYRPEYQHGWGSKTYYTQLRLDPLPPASADELLQALLGHDPSLARACYGGGFVSLCKGDLHQAIARLERGLALCQTWSIRDWFLVLAAALGDAYALSGRLAEALPLLEQTVEQDAMRRRHLSSLWIAWLSEGYMLADRLANAMPLARQALDLARDGRERGCEAWALRLLGEIHSHQDSLDADQAAAHYRQALALAEALGMRPLQAHCHRGLGTLYTKIDQREQAVPNCLQPSRCTARWT